MCDATAGDSGRSHWSACYCHEEQGGGYTYNDEYGDCAFCRGEFEEGTVICADKHNDLRGCPDTLILNPTVS